MKNRPEPKKISYIKPNNNKNINIIIKSNNKNVNKTKKPNDALINNLLIINSPKKTYISSSNKINEKLFNKIKQYSLEAHLLNQAINISSKNNNKNIKSNQENNNSINKKTKKKEELRYNSLDSKSNIPKPKRKTNNINKIYTDRSFNPFIKTQKINKNIQIKTYSNEKEKYSEKKIQNLRNLKNNNLNMHHSLSKERKKTNILNTNFKYTKPKLLTTFNMKRNASANSRIIGNKKLSNNILGNKDNKNSKNKKENEEEFNINNIEENENLLFDIHTSYNLTSKNPFNFYSSELQFRSSKNMLKENEKNKKINFGIKEENENDDNNSEFSFRKEKLNNSNDNQFYEINSNYFNEIKKRTKIKNNKKENALSSLHKNGINFDSINKEILSKSEFKGFFTPDKLEYSLEKQRKSLNMKNKDKNINKYYILRNNGIIYTKKINNIIGNDKNNININNIYEKQKKLYKKENFFYNNNKIKYRNKNENDKNKSPSHEKNNNSNYNYHNDKLYFINSPSGNLSNINKRKIENSYDDTFKLNKQIKFHKILQNKKLKDKEKNNTSKYDSKSHSHSKPKSRAKSHLNKIGNSKKDSKLIKLIFIIKTNWGNIIKIGINNIKLLDKNNRSIPIKYANFDVGKPYIAKYLKGETKKLILGYNKKYNLKHILILNGFNDTGVKYLMIENDRGKILWKGNIPKTNMINVKKYYIQIDNYNYNTNNNTNKKNLIYSKTIFLNREENNNLTNLKHMTNTFRLNQQNYEVLKKKKKNYELCDKIKIKLLNNYGNRDYIGLSGIEFYDNNNKLINILENKKNITINESIVNLREKKILYNLFNNKNDTIDPQYMFLTTNYNAFIKIEFKQIVKISKIIFYNYNNNIYKDCATKGILIYFYYNKKSNKLDKPIYLYKPPGEENIDYGQVLLYPFDKNIFYEKMIQQNKIYLSLNSSKMIFNEEYQYYTPFLPFGYILKIEMINNYGNKNYIGFENIQLFNEENNEINLEFISKKKNIYKFIDYSTDYNENIDSNDINTINPRIYSLPDLQKINLINRPMILSKYHYFNDSNNELGENRIYFIFNECIILSRICINNYNKYLDIAAKDIKILLDDKIIFEGALKNMGINNIYFNEKKNLKGIDKNFKKVLSNNSSTLSKGFENNHNDVFKHNFLRKTFDFKQNEFNYKNNEERYIEYEGKNGTKILKLNPEL